MSVFTWIVVGYLVLSTIAYVSQIGKPREPITPSNAAFVMVVMTLVIAGIIAGAVG